MRKVRKVRKAVESVQGVGCRCVDCEVWLAVRNVNAKGRTQGVECRGV